MLSDVNAFFNLLAIAFARSSLLALTLWVNLQESQHARKVDLKLLKHEISRGCKACHEWEGKVMTSRPIVLPCSLHHQGTSHMTIHNQYVVQRHVSTFFFNTYDEVVQTLVKQNVVIHALGCIINCAYIMIHILWCSAPDNVCPWICRILECNLHWHWCNKTWKDVCFHSTLVELLVVLFWCQRPNSSILSGLSTTLIHIPNAMSIVLLKLVSHFGNCYLGGMTQCNTVNLFIFDVVKNMIAKWKIIYIYIYNENTIIMLDSWR